MKTIGVILVAIGVGLLLLAIYSYFREAGKTHSPVPEDRGVKVIFVTPSLQSKPLLLSYREFEDLALVPKKEDVYGLEDEKRTDKQGESDNCIL